MKYTLYLISSLALCFSSCTSIQLAIPHQFSTQATKMPVKGLKHWTGRGSVSFGEYRTSKIKRGWNTTSTRPKFLSELSTEEAILMVMGAPVQNLRSNQKTKYQYSIQDRNLVADVFCFERKTEESSEIKTGSRWLGDLAQTKNYQYQFSAAIRSTAKEHKEPWKVVLYNNYHWMKDTARRILDHPYIEEEGYATDGKDTIHINPVRVTNFTTKSGRDAKFPVKILTGYELRIGDGVIAIIDAFGHNLWMYNELDAPTRLIVASVSSALLLRQVQDVTGG